MQVVTTALQVIVNCVTAPPSLVYVLPAAATAAPSNNSGQGHVHAAGPSSRSSAPGGGGGAFTSTPFNAWRSDRYVSPMLHHQPADGGAAGGQGHTHVRS